MGILAMVVSAGLLAGPGIGGILTTYLGWKSIFLINIPIGFLGWTLSKNFIPDDLNQSFSNSFKIFDWKGSVLQALIILTLILLFDPPGFSSTHTFDALTDHPEWAFVFSVIFSVLFIANEKKAKQPIFDLNLLKISSFTKANLASLFLFTSYSGFMILMPFYLETILGLSLPSAGAHIMIIPFSLLIMSPISGRLSDKIGSRILTTLGTSVLSLSLFLLFQPWINYYPVQNHALLVLVLIGVGLGTALFQSPNNCAVLSSVPLQKIGIASALVATTRNLGLIFGTGIASRFFTSHLERSRDFSHSLRIGFLFCAVVAAAASFTSFLNIISSKKESNGLET